MLMLDPDNIFRSFSFLKCDCVCVSQLEGKNNWANLRANEFVGFDAFKITECLSEQCVYFSVSSPHRCVCLYHVAVVVPQVGNACVTCGAALVNLCFLYNLILWSLSLNPSISVRTALKAERTTTFVMLYR